MHLRSEEREAKEFLERLDVVVLPVPTGSGKTPEFLVDGDARGYVVEVKARNESHDWLREAIAGGIAEQSRPTGYDRWVEDVSRYALKQFRAIDPNHERFWVVWISIRATASATEMLEQTIGSLFGVRQVVDVVDFSKECPMWEVLFARPGVFERHHEIVGVVICADARITLCVNEFSDDFSAFCGSRLYDAFRFLPPISATDLVTERGFFAIHNASIDRRDQAALAEYFRAEYGLANPFVIDMTTHSATIFQRDTNDP